MPTQKTISGDLFLIPVEQEYEWGTNVSDLLYRLADDDDGEFQVVTASGNSTVINFDEGKNVDLTLSSNTIISFLNPRPGRPAVFWINQTASYAITWPGNIKWPDGTPPEMDSDGTYIVTLIYNSYRYYYVGEYGSRYS